MSERGNSHALKLIGLIITGVLFVGGAVASGYKVVDEAKDYTDQNIRYLREEQAKKTEKMAEDLSKVKSDMAVVRTILEERFVKPR